MSIIDEIYNPVKMESVDFGLRRIPEGLLEYYNVDMNPDYQRSHVWSREQRQEYIGFILQGGTTPPIVINKTNEVDCAVVDGKQRLTSICKWLDGEFPALTHDRREVHVEQFREDKTSWIGLNTSITIEVGFVDLTRAEVLDYYLRLNSGGTVHDEEEIERVRELLEEET